MMLLEAMGIAVLILGVIALMASITVALGYIHPLLALLWVFAFLTLCTYGQLSINN